jgi:hypothetical protein
VTAALLDPKVLLDCSNDQLYDLIKAGELDSYVEATRRKITTASIERLIAKRLGRVPAL